ncbi:MAG TPA: hypothetical protein VK308_09835, partial [Pyrinomonadaceae bacterium]|nr:hypothetical protein [Pyrinomonadaceae bacterium]
MEWSRAIEPKKPAQAVSSVDREKTIYQPAVTIKNQLSDHLSKINWKENVVLKINQSEDAALPEVFVSIESEGRSKVIARISKNVAGYIYQPDGAASQVNALDYETMFDYLKEDIEAGHDFLAVQKREHLDIVAGKVNQSYSDTARVLNHYLTEQGRNDLEASVLVKNDGNSVESWINIIRYNYVKVEKNVIGRVTQGTDSFNFVIGTEENEVYEIENLARFIIEAEVKFRDQQKNPPVQEAGIPAIDMEAYENSTAQRPEFDWDAENNFSPEEVRADYFKETFALADSVLQLEGKTATNVYLTKSAELEHKKNIARLRQDKSDLAFHVSETGQYFGEASESYIRSELEARGISITKDYEVLVGHDRTAYLTRAEDAASTAEFDNPWDAWNENRFRGGEGADETAIRNDRLYRVIPQGELQVHLIQRAVALSAISEKGFAVAVKTNDGASGRAGEFFVYEGKNEIENQKFSSFSEAVKFLSENNDTGKFLEIPANYEFDTAFADNVQYAFYKFSGDGKPLDYLIEAKEIIGEDTVE